MPSQQNILFISAFNAPFIQEDYEWLSRHYNVHRITGNGIVTLIKIFVALLQTDILFCWFASTSAALSVAFAKFLGIKTAIVLGGVDTAADKEIGYGMWLTSWKSRLLRYAIRKSDSILVVDPSLKDEIIQRVQYNGNNVVYIPTGYDSQFWKPLGEKKVHVLTIAAAENSTRFRVKGIDFLIEAAQQLPTVEFTVIGIQPPLAYSFRPPLNIKFIPMVAREKLLPYYQQAKVYCQPSRREGLSNALCEAMLCGCIPVATKVGGNPTAISGAGYLVEYGNVEELVTALQEALESEDDIPAKARARIVGLFPEERRRNELLAIMKQLCE